MTREEHLKFCRQCKKRSFNSKSGIICSLTQEIAAFENECEHYEEDEIEARNFVRQEKEEKSETNKVINIGRIVLFFLGAVYLVIGVLEGYYIDNHHILFAIIDWTIAGVFIGTAIWSFYKAFYALLTGLIMYLLLTVLLVIAEPMMLLNGIVWKIFTVVFLTYAIRAAKGKEKKVQIEDNEILDL